MMKDQSFSALIESLRDLADFLRPLNKYWPAELDRLAAEAEAAFAGGDRQEVRETFAGRLENALYDRKGLKELYVSSPVKREQFVRKKAALRECLKALKALK